jgi:hypothetical protein
MSQESKHSPARRPRFSRRTFFLSLTGLVAALSIFGAHRYYSSRPQTPAQARNAVAAHLKKQTGWSHFNSFADLTADRNPWQTLKAQFDNAADYKVIYRAIGEDLCAADKLINHPDALQQAKGLQLVREICLAAQDTAVDGWLAARIVEGYLLSSLSKVDAQAQDKYIQFANQVYAAANEKNKQIDLYKMILANGSVKKREDVFRLRLADLLAARGDYQEALLYFRQITDGKLTPNARQRIAAMEQKLKRKG